MEAPTNSWAPEINLTISESLRNWWCIRGLFYAAVQGMSNTLLHNVPRSTNARDDQYTSGSSSQPYLGLNFDENNGTRLRESQSLEVAVEPIVRDDL
jgi:hypothetical protein